ncbi:hypothetical protein GGF38_001993 [Coemansia sp. RSA 25]|nr:hypothetical protein GGF38_001993 [Coemansia sp. RSA 25]
MDSDSDSDSDSEYELKEPAPARPAVDTSSKESSSSEEGAPPPRTAPVNLEKRDVYVEILVDGQGSESGGESERDGDTDRADVSANTPLDAATHTNTDSAGATADSNPLLVGSQARHSEEDDDDDEEEDDGGFLNEGNRINSAPPAGSGSMADLAVLDFMSQRVIDEINTLAQALDGESNITNATFRRLDCYAHGQVLVRKNHFTRELFITGDQRPLDDDDIVQWASSLQRINMATFLLLVVRPLIAVAKPVSSSMPNRERMISSMGLRAAAQGLFANVVPANLRNVETVDLLVDLVTQQILAAANDERHLQTLVSDERDISDAGIAQLLAIEDYGGSSGTNRRDTTAHFDAYAVAHYRKELGRRLSRISGGRLHTARSLYSPQALWKKVAEFCGQCSTSWRTPSILGDQQGRQADTSFNALDDADKADEHSDDTDDSGRDIVLDAEHQVADEPAAEEAESATGDLNANAAPIDPSFREERRVATLLRDVRTDPHLEELLEAIDAEHIDISDQQVQSHTPRRVRPARRHVFAQVPDHGADEGNNDDSDKASEFRPDAEEEYASASGSADERVDSRSSRQTGAHRRLGKRRVASDGSSENDTDEDPMQTVQDILRTIRVPVKRRRPMPQEEAETSRQAGGFRGRRGIAAEDPSELGDASRGRVAFTPSASSSPAPNARRGNGSAGGAGRAGLEALGQYRPLKLAQNMPAHAASAGGGSSSRGNERTRHDDHSEHSDYSDAGRGAAGQARGRHAKPVQRRVRWSEDEESCLLLALSEFGPQWALILQHYGERGSRSRVLRRRTRPNLKDKARNIKRRLIRENKPLGPLAEVTG